MRAAPCTLFGSYCRDHTRGRRLIVLILQTTVDLEILKELKGRCFLLCGRYEYQDPHLVGTGQASPPSKWVFILRRFAERSIPR